MLIGPITEEGDQRAERKTRRLVLYTREIRDYYAPRVLGPSFGRRDIARVCRNRRGV